MQNERDGLTGRLEAYGKSCVEPLTGKSSVDLKILTSAAAGFGLLLACPHAEAAIVYKGPYNISLSNNTFTLDMDSDGIADFDLVASNTGFASTTSSILYSYKIGIAGIIPLVPGASWVGTSSFPEKLSGGYAVGPNPVIPWYSSFGALAYSVIYTYSGDAVFNTFTGNFAGERGFIGIRFEISGETKYGWIDFEGVVGQPGRVIIHDWAYEACSDTAIEAGATSGGADCEAIPTLNEWGMIILVGLLAAGGLAYSRKEEALS